MDEKSFTSSESIKKKVEVKTFNIGDTIDIKYSCKDYDESSNKIERFCKEQCA